MTDLVPHTHRMMHIMLKNAATHVNIINVYMPHVGHATKVKETHYNMLEK